MPAVARLSLYLRQLEQLAAGGAERVSSRQLAGSLRTTAAQVRKDLAYFGQFGQPGLGYNVSDLIRHLRRILGTDKVSKVVLVGAGNLGSALLRYRGFRKKGFEIAAAFDVSRSRVGSAIGEVKIHRLDDLPKIVRDQRVRLAIMAVPAEAAQGVADLLCGAGIRGILNFAPATLDVPSDVTVDPVDLAGHMEQLSFHVASRTEEG
jgi:redox-sensing transcriptional repressor